MTLFILYKFPVKTLSLYWAIFNTMFIQSISILVASLLRTGTAKRGGQNVKLVSQLSGKVCANRRTKQRNCYEIKF